MLCKVHLGECVGLCAYICMQRPKEVIRGLSLLLSSCLNMDHFVESEAYYFGEAGRQLLGIHLSLSSSAGVMYMCSHSDFLSGCWRFKVRLCRTNTLTLAQFRDFSFGT